MKKVFLLWALLVSVVGWAGPDEFHVIHLKGQLINKSTGQPLKVGDKINVNDQIKFGSADAAAVVISTQRGRFTIKPQAASASSSELVAMVKNVVLPIKSNANLSTRGGEADGIIDLKSYFGSGKYAVIGDKLSLKLNAGKYPVSDTKMFIYRYELNGTPVSKKIEHNGESLVFDKSALYTVQGNAIEPEKVEFVEIYYFDKATQNSQLITKFSPVFLNESVLKNELKAQVDFFKTQNYKAEEIHKEILGFIQDIYGKVDEDLVNRWIKHHLVN